jgi:hypothetical protein
MRYVWVGVLLVGLCGCEGEGASSSADDGGVDPLDARMDGHSAGDAHVPQDGAVDGGEAADAVVPTDGEFGVDGGLDAGDGAIPMDDAPAEAADAAADAEAREDAAMPSDASGDGSADACVHDPACDDGNECTCNPRLADGGCGMENRPRCTPCQAGTMSCVGGTCIGACDHIPGECSVAKCDPDAASGCAEEPKLDCAPCEFTAGVCIDGECITDGCPSACDSADCPEE